MRMNISTVSLKDEPTIQGYADALAQAIAFDTPGIPPATPAMVKRQLQHPLPDRTTHCWVAWSASGQAIGRAQVAIGARSKPRVGVLQLDVVPHHRRRGVGAALLAKAVALATSESCETLVARTISSGNKEAAAFPSSHGFIDAELPEVMRRLNLRPRSEGIPLSRIVSMLEAGARDYEILPWRDLTEQQLADHVAYLESRLTTDAPMGGLPVGEQRLDGHWLHDTELTRAARGEIAFHVGAIHRPSRRLAAYTLVTADQQQPHHAWQQITIVDPGHRGHRLGMLIKAANLRAVTQALPALTAIDTFNAQANTHMIAINEALGMNPIHGFRHWYRHLS